MSCMDDERDSLESLTIYEIVEKRRFSFMVDSDEVANSTASHPPTVYNVAIVRPIHTLRADRVHSRAGFSKI